MAQNKINILPREVANKIAAGEVVERPASVVKELIENSLDAGSTRIEIEIEDAGRKLIKVIDDGEGMTEGDIKLAPLRHSTSKIREASDLNNINSLGFRGEALASMAAVSHLKISSCAKGAAEAWEVKVEGGEVKKTVKTARSQGTTVELRNLFFNVPARMKFLKSDAAETSQIIKTVTELALAYPKAGFKLISRKKEILNVSPDGKLFDRIYALLGKEIADDLISIKSEMPALKIRGYVGRAGAGQNTRNNQYVFVNGRPVKDKVIYHAITQGYHTFLAERQFAPLVLFIEIAPAAVDVNVHPSKREIRFRNSNFIHSSLSKAIRQALSGREHLPNLVLREKPAAGKSYQPFVKPVQPAGGFDEKIAKSEWGLISAKDEKEPVLFKQKDEFDFEAASLPLSLQLKNSYIISSEEDGVVIIDQHAAHERVLFDELLTNFKKKNIEKQKLLLPVTLSLSKAEVELMSEYKDFFQELGFDVEEFGKDTFCVQSYPVVLGKIEIESVFANILSEISQLEISTDVDKQIAQFLAPIACHSAVRANDKLSQEQINSILKRLWETESPYTCPHGRPTMIRMSWSELEKKFKRK